MLTMTLNLSPTLSLNPRTHLFIKGDKLFFKVYKFNRYSDKKDYSVVNDVPISDLYRIKAWIDGQIERYSPPNPADLNANQFTPANNLKGANHG